MTETSLVPLDANRKPVRVGNVVRRTLVVDHAGKLHTTHARGVVVDILPNGAIVITTATWEMWSVRPWPASEWSITGDDEAFS